MQQKPYPNENKRYRYVFLPIESLSRLQENLESILTKGVCKDEMINVRSDYEVLLSFNSPKTWELKVVPAEDKTKTISQIAITDMNSFMMALTTTV